MIFPRHNRLYKIFFDFYTRQIIRSDFKEFFVEEETENFKDNPVLVLANHFSWWDGFLHYHLNNIFFKKQFHVMMLEEQLKKRMFLTKLGIFGVKKGTKEAVASLNFAASLLENPENMVLIFPQGRIESQHQHLFRFEKGAEVLISRSKHIKVIFAVCLIDYFSERKPVARIFLKDYQKMDNMSLESAFNMYFKECLDKQLRLAV